MLACSLDLNSFTGLGYSKLFNPQAPQGLYDLDLAMFEERQIALMLVQLYNKGCGEWKDLMFSYVDSEENWKTATSLPHWTCAEEELPRVGHIRGRFIKLEADDGGLAKKMTKTLGWR